MQFEVECVMHGRTNGTWPDRYGVSHCLACMERGLAAASRVASTRLPRSDVAKMQNAESLIVLDPIPKSKIFADFFRRVAHNWRVLGYDERAKLAVEIAELVDE